MVMCTLVKLEAYRERGSHMRRIATVTKGGSQVLWDGRAVGHSQRMRSAAAFFIYLKTLLFTQEGFFFFALLKIQLKKKYKKTKRKMDSQM